jgi:hypothetical protein
MSLFRRVVAGLGVLMVLVLSGCGEKKPTYSYLMLHPEELQRTYNQCVQQVVPPSLPCEMVMQAQAEFTDLMNQREQDPERFGARLLQEQENSIYLKSKVDAAWKAYQIVGASKPTLENLKVMRLAVDKAEAQYQASAEQVRILLTVIAATSRV